MNAQSTRFHPLQRLVWVGLISAGALILLFVLLSSGITPAFADSPPSEAAITREPAGPLFPGAVVQFTATATGTQPFTYTWTLNGVDVGGNVPTWTYTFTNAGLYTVSVLISNTFGQDSATLLVPVRGCEARVQGSGVVYTDVQAAIDAAPPGGVVQLAGACRGVATRGGLTQTAYVSKSLTLRGGYAGLGDWGAPDPLAYPTLLDAQNTGRALVIIGPATVTVEGLTLTGGKANGLGGLPGYDASGGVYLSGATVTLTNCAVVSNTISTGGGRGGGVAINGGSVVIANSRLAFNRADDGSDYTSEYGGGLYVYGGTVQVLNSELSDNYTYRGSGAYLAQNGDFTFTGNIIARNALAWGGAGGGIYLEEGALRFENNTVEANQGEGVYAQGAGLRIAGNTFRNQDGRALYLSGDGLTVQGNTLLSNRYGMEILGTGLIAGNIVSGTWGSNYTYPGALILRGRADQTAGQTFTVTGNLILRNRTIANGGGIYAEGYRITFENNVIAFNHADGNGSGLYLAPHSGTPYRRYYYTLVHNTFNGNTGAHGIFVREELGWQTGAIQAEFRHNIIANHETGINVRTGNDVTLIGTLWHGNTTDVAGTATRSGDLTGDPAFAADGYHLGAGSAALDAGSTIAGLPWQDVDGEARPAGLGYDIGADEVAGVALQVTQTPGTTRLAHGETVIYADTIHVASGDATNLVVTTTLPAEQRPLTATSSRGTCALVGDYGGGAVCTPGDTPSGTTVYITVTAQMTTTPPPPAQMPRIMTTTLTARAVEARNVLATPLAFQYCFANVNGVVYDSLQAAVDAAPVGALVKVAGYCDSLNARGSEIAYITKTLTVRGGYTVLDWTSSDPVAQPTTLDARLSGHVLLIEGSGAAPTVEGLRIINGNGARAGAGGGILVREGAAPTLQANVLEGNIATYDPDGMQPGTGSGAGGAIGIYNAPGTRVLSNTLRANFARVGGGLRIRQSDNVLVQGNQFLNNRAGDSGGGLSLDNSSVAIADNLLRGNLVESSNGRGGALDIVGGAPTLRGNTVEQNSAAYGGGIAFDSDDALVEENVIATNTATASGGGIYVSQYGRPTLVANTITSNTAKTGGGLYYSLSSYEWARLTLRHNRIAGNQATEGGGGLYAEWRASGELIGNVFANNSATGNGGGLFIERFGYNGAVTIHSNAVVGNHATGQGGGIYLQTSFCGVWRHTTLGQNTSSDNAAVTLYLFESECPPVTWEHNLFYNQTVGIRQGSTIGGVVRYTLWDNVPTPTLGADLTREGDITGTAALAADGYHLTAASAAVDAAVFSTLVATDVDGEPRPMGAYADLGADELALLADLGLRKQVQGSGPYPAGLPITYTLTVSAAQSSQVAANVVVVDRIIPPAAVAQVEATAQGGVCQSAGAVITCTLVVPTGAARLITTRITPTAQYAGVLTNTARLTVINAVDPNPADNAAGPVTATVYLPIPDLWITKTASAAYIQAGQTLAYQVRWGNRGVVAASGVVVTDTLPEGVTFVAATGDYTRNGRVVVWQVGQLAPGAETTQGITVTVDGGVSNNTVLTNTAHIAGTNGEGNPADNAALALTTVSDTGGVQLIIEQQVLQEDVPVEAIVYSINPAENQVRYKVTVINNGTVDARTQVQVLLPAGTQPAATQPDPNVRWDPGTQSFIWGYDIIRANNLVVFYVDVVVNACHGVTCGIIRSTVAADVSGLPYTWINRYDLLVKCPALAVEVNAPLYYNYGSGELRYPVDIVYQALNVPTEKGNVGVAANAWITLTLDGTINFEEVEADPLPDWRSADFRVLVWHGNLHEVQPGNEDRIRLYLSNQDLPPGAWEPHRFDVASIAYAMDAQGKKVPLPECSFDDNIADGRTDIVQFRLEHVEDVQLAPRPQWVYENQTPRLVYDTGYLLRYQYFNTYGGGFMLLDHYAIRDDWPAALNFLSFDSNPELKVLIPGRLWEATRQLMVGQQGLLLLRGRTNRPLQPLTQLVNRAWAEFEPDNAPQPLPSEETTKEEVIPIVPPLWTHPSVGTTVNLCATPLNVTMGGLAQPDANIRLFRDGQPVNQTTAGADGSFNFSGVLNTPGQYTFQASARFSDTESARTPGPTFRVRSDYRWDPYRSYWEGTIQAGPLQGQRVRFDGFRDAQGNYAAENWQLPGMFGFWNTNLNLFVCPCPDVAPTYVITVTADGIPYARSGTGFGYVRFNIAAAHNVNIHGACVGTTTGPGGEPITVVTGTQSVNGTVLIDPDGFVFDINQGGDYSGPGGMFNPVQAISGVTVTAYMSAPEMGGWIPWPAHVYSQTNPQVTDATYPDGITTTGYFAFFTPPGHYYLEIEGIPGYQAWRSPVIEVITQIVHVNVPYTPWTNGNVYTVTVTPESLLPAVITVPVGSTVAWRSTVTATTTLTDYVRFTENPVLRIRSILDPLADTRAFDAGYLEPGRVYRRQFHWPGVYPYTDGAGHSGVIVVQGAAPPLTVDLGGPATGYVGEPLTFTAAVAPPTATLPITYTWRTAGGEWQNVRHALSDTATFTWTAAGEQAITVTVQNPYTTATASQAVLINRWPQTITFPPLADKPYNAPPFTITATASSGLPVTFTAEGVCSVEAITVTLTGSGVCTITAHQAGDAVYAPAPDVMRAFTVAPPPCNPPASVQITGPATTTVGVPTIFTATVTPLTMTVILPFTFPLTYTWQATNYELRITNYGNSLQDTAAFTWTAAGTRVVTVTVASPCGTTVQDTELITVAAPPVQNRPPVADAGPDQTVAPGALVTLDGAASSDPDGDALLYRWRQTGGAAVSFTPTLSRTTFLAASPGVLTFTLTVTDTGGLTHSDSVVVTVEKYRIYLPLVLRNP